MLVKCSSPFRKFKKAGRPSSVGPRKWIVPCVLRGCTQGGSSKGRDRFHDVSGGGGGGDGDEDEDEYDAADGTSRAPRLPAAAAVMDGPAHIKRGRPPRNAERRPGWYNMIVGNCFSRSDGAEEE